VRRPPAERAGPTGAGRAIERVAAGTTVNSTARRGAGGGAPVVGGGAIR